MLSSTYPNNDVENNNDNDLPPQNKLTKYPCILSWRTKTEISHLKKLQYMYSSLIVHQNSLKHAHVILCTINDEHCTTDVMSKWSKGTFTVISVLLETTMHDATDCLGNNISTSHSRNWQLLWILLTLLKKKTALKKENRLKSIFDLYKNLFQQSSTHVYVLQTQKVNLHNNTNNS